MIRIQQPAPRDPRHAWDLLARPARWPEWAPHVRGAWGLGEPEVELGRIGAARLFGLLPVPARIVGKTADRDWTWQVGPVRMRHWAEPGAVGIDLSAPGPLEGALGATYAPVIRWSLRRLAERAAAAQPSV